MRSVACVAFICFVALVHPSGAGAFTFESLIELEDAREEVRRLAPLGTAREVVRASFVTQGGAKLFGHPSRASVEKYVYDIDLCGRYVWRWNISANFDADDRLTQIFVNGEPIHAAGDAARVPAGKPGAEESIAKAWRPRPEASSGESKIAYLLYDLDAGTDDIDDEFVAGAGPSRADPNDLGFVHGYTSVERWRSIFDDEQATAVVPYAGDCR